MSQYKIPGVKGHAGIKESCVHSKVCHKIAKSLPNLVKLNSFLDVKQNLMIFEMENG